MKAKKDGKGKRLVDGLPPDVKGVIAATPAHDPTGELCACVCACVCVCVCLIVCELSF